MTQNQHGIFRFIIFLLVGMACAFSHAGFLDMPDIKEMPEAENDILLKDLDIPGVRDRTPDPDAGPRLNVTAFRVQGIVEYPELGITREKLIALVEGIRHDMMEEDELLYSGYTLEELSELQDLMVDIEKETRHEHVGPFDVQRIVFLIRDQRRRRGITLGMLETVADKITDYYRQRGFILAKAFVPEQEVRDGVVTLTLLLGYLGGVDLENNKRYGQKAVDRVFADTMSKPVTTDVMERKLYYLNDMPGLQVQGFFSPGDQVGDTKLKVNVVEEKAYDVNMRIDNHGSDVTGEYRLYTDFIWNNPLKYGDYLHLAVLGAIDPESATYGMARYGGPIMHYRWQYDVAVSQNAFVLGLEQNDVSSVSIGGVSTSYDLGLSYSLTRSRTSTSSVSLRASHIDASLKYRSESLSSEFRNDVVRNYEVAYHFDFLDEQQRSVHVGSVHVTRSEVIDALLLGNAAANEEDAWIAGVDYTSLRFVGMPFGSRSARLVVRAGLQYTGKQLLSINQFALAGPTRSRGYKTNTFFADDGAHVGVDLMFQELPVFDLKERVQPYVFLDAAYGVSYLEGDINAESRSKNTAALLNAGVGLKLSLFDSLRGNLSVAKPVETDISNDFDIEENEELKLYFDLQYSL